MWHFDRLPSQLLSLLGVTGALLLLLVVACGAAGKPAAPAAAPKKEAPVAAAPTKAPAAAPAKAPAPAAAVVHPGKVTVMVGALGNERAHPRYCLGECNGFGRLLHAYFATTTHQGGVLPYAAESWRISPDGKVWTTKLRKGIKFHNGEVATVEDALFSLDRPLSLDEFPDKADAANQTEGRRIEKYEITGPDEVAVTFKVPNPYFPGFRSEGTAGNLKITLIPKKLLGEPFDKNEPAYEKNPIGAGPMKMISRSPAQSMSFERFDDFFYHPGNGLPEDRRVQFKFLDLKIVPELSTRVAALRAVEADLVEAAVAVKDQVVGAGGRLIFAQESSYVGMTVLGCWKAAVRCSDKRVREALDIAVDRQVILNALYTKESYSMEGWVHVTPNSLGYDPRLKGFPFQPERARELMKAAGYKVPGSPSGKDFGKLNLYTYNAGDVPFIPDMAQLIAEFWKKELGLDVAVVVGDRVDQVVRQRGRDLDDHVRLYTNEARWDGGLLDNIRYNDPTGTGRIAQVPENADLAKAVQDGLGVVDPDKRQEAMAKMHLILQDAHLDLAFGYTNLPWAASKRVADWRPWPTAAFFNAAYTLRLK